LRVALGWIVPEAVDEVPTAGRRREGDNPPPGSCSTFELVDESVVRQAVARA